VGTQRPTDNTGNFDTPQLTNIALTAPYLHDGSAPTLETIWTLYNLQDQHGRTNDLAKDELNDLIEYLRTR
jgi:cytochrome c peroxidase